MIKRIPQILFPGYILVILVGWETTELKKRKKTDPKGKTTTEGDSLWICTCQQNQINVNSCMFKKMRRFLSAQYYVGYVTIHKIH